MVEKVTDSIEPSLNQDAKNQKTALLKNQKHKRVKYEDVSEAQVRKKMKNDLYKPPTVKELNELKETENLYNNNLFRLQIKELVTEIAIKNKRKKEFSVWLDSFKTALENIPEYEAIPLSEIKPIKSNKLKGREKFINNISSKYDLAIVKTDQDILLNFLKPESFETFGLYENNSLPGPNLQIDLNVKMPKSCFLSKDFLNNRYFIKRYIYLLYIAEHINETEIAHQMKMSFQENNLLMPILEIQPTESGKLLIVIHVTPCDDCFKPTRFVPEMNNIRLDLFDLKFNDPKVLKDTPTVYYNSVLAHDVTLSLNNHYIKSILSEQENIQEGIKLLCVWLKQRDVSVGFGVFTENLILYFFTYLLAKKKINKFMSSYQIVRNFWNFVSTTNLEENPISIADNVKQEVLDTFKKSFDIVFLDKSGCYNFTSFLNISVYRKVKTECELALKHLNNNNMNSFQLLFLTKLPFYLQYDLIIDLTDALPLEGKYHLSDAEKAKYIGYHDMLIVNHITSVLKKGLNQRIINLVPRIEMDKCKEQPYSMKKLLFGVNLNPDKAFNYIEIGPALSEFVEADLFRKFWTHLSSDRRFRDGSTYVAVYFKTNTIKAKRDIIKKVLKYLLKEKLDINYNLYYDEFDEVLINKKIISPYPIGTNEEGSLKIISISDDLGKKIRSLQMSLSVTGILGLSNVYSYTEVFPPVAANYKLGQSLITTKGNSMIFSKSNKIGMIPKYVQPVECVLQLEHSSKWPNTIEGVRYLMTSFYIEMSKMLHKTHQIISHPQTDYMDVFYEGLVFRYRLYVPKEITLLKRESMEDGSICYKDSFESNELEKKLNILPRLQGALKGLQLQNPSYGPGTALIKRWLRSQLIDDSHFPDVVIHLLNASLYLNSTPFMISNTPQISFLRFLKFISELQWRLQPVVFNFNEELSKEDIYELESKFQQNRNSFQSLYIIIPYDEGRSEFTKQAPSVEVLHRVQQLAMGVLNYVDNFIRNQRLPDIKNCFVPNWEGYNLLIHLRPLLNPRRHEQIIDVDPDSKIILEKYNSTESTKIPIVGFNPVDLYLSSLRENYGDFATFFHDTFGGNIIGVLWNPKSLEAQNFKVSLISGKKFDGGKLILNLDAIIEDFYILGKDLVKTIEKQ